MATSESPESSDQENSSTRDASSAQVLEFELEDETYCIDITYVAEIVDNEDLTEVPNTPRHVEGVIDLRGRTTSIVNPKTVLGLQQDQDCERIIVLDPDHFDDEAVGWIVDDVKQVVDVDPDNLDDPATADHESVRGVLRREDDFVIWLDPREV